MKTVEASPDRELVLLATTLERLAARVESQLDPDASEAAGTDVDDLLAYAHRCVAILDEPNVAARLSIAFGDTK